MTGELINNKQTLEIEIDSQHYHDETIQRFLLVQRVRKQNYILAFYATFNTLECCSFLPSAFLGGERCEKRNISSLVPIKRLYKSSEGKY